MPTFSVRTKHIKVGAIDAVKENGASASLGTPFMSWPRQTRTITLILAGRASTKSRRPFAVFRGGATWEIFLGHFTWANLTRLQVELFI